MAAEDRKRSVIDALRGRLEAIESEKGQLLAEIARLERAEMTPASGEVPPGSAETVSATSDAAAKIKLFRSLFRGREDVFPRRWHNPKTGKSGYSPSP